MFVKGSLVWYIFHFFFFNDDSIRSLPLLVYTVMTGCVLFIFYFLGRNMVMFVDVSFISTFLLVDVSFGSMQCNAVQCNECPA